MYSSNMKLILVVLCGVLVSCGVAKPSGEFVGVSADGKVSLAVLSSSDNVVAYVCNDADIGAWFHSDRGETKLRSARGDLLTLTPNAKAFSAVLQTNAGASIEFKTELAKEGEGLFMLASEGSAPSSSVAKHAPDIIKDALQRLVIKADASSASEGFRAGWVVGPGEAFRGNLSSSNLNKAPSGVPVVMSAGVVRRATVPGGVVMDGIKKKKTLDQAGTSTAVPSSNPCGDIDFMNPSTCCTAIKFNQLLIAISNEFAEHDIESETLDSMLNECANNMTAFCPNNAAASCNAT